MIVILFLIQKFLNLLKNLVFPNKSFERTGLLEIRYKLLVKAALFNFVLIFNKIQ